MVEIEKIENRNIILVIEPDKLYQEKLKDLLIKDYPDTIFTSDSEEAFCEAKRFINRIGLVLLATKLPDKSAFEMVREISSLGIRVPNFVFLADDEIPENIIKSMTIAGAYDYVLKSTNDTEMLEIVRNGILIDIKDFRRGNLEYAKRGFVEEALSHRNLKISEEMNFLLEKKRDDCIDDPLYWPIEFFKDPYLELNFAHGDYSNRKNYPLKLLLRELENDTGEKAPMPWRFKILIVEDENSMLSGLKLLLEEEYFVLIADNGEKAFDIIKNNPDLDIVLLDIGLPDIKGTDLIKKSNDLYKLNYLDGEDYKINGPTFIALTAFQDAETIKGIIKDGASDYIVKPFENSELLLKIKEAASKRYYYKVIRQLLDLLDTQKLSFRARLLLTDYTIERNLKKHGIDLPIAMPIDLFLITKYFKEYLNLEKFDFDIRFPGMSLETNLKEYILILKELAKKHKKLDYIPLINQCGFKTKREIKEEAAAAALEKKLIVKKDVKKDMTDKEYKELGISILIIEDEEILLTALKYTFEDIIYKIYTALNGQEAIRFVNEHPEISLILTDINLPDISGYDLINNILNIYQKRTFLPEFIIMTGYDVESVKIDQHKDKIAAIFSKGTEKSKLINTVKNILKEKKNV